MQFLKIRVNFLKAKPWGRGCSQSGHVNFIAKRRKPRLNGHPELVHTILTIVLHYDSLKGGHVSTVGTDCRFYGDCCHCSR